MLATSGQNLPTGDRWSYEVKWDGYRTLALKDGATIKLLSRNLKNMTLQYRSVARAVAKVPAQTALLDGEIVAVDADGRPSFQALHHQSAHTVVYYAFDLLYVDGRDLTRLPLDERRDALARLLDGTGILRSEPLPGTADQIADAVRGAGLEGVVAKRKDSRYEPGKRSAAWVKVKFNRRQEFVVGGFKPSGKSLESLVVGYYERWKLHFAARVRAGLTPRTRVEIFDRIAGDRTERCPFANLPSRSGGHWGEGVTPEEMLKLRWVKPTLVVEVSFVEWTLDGNLRHSEFVAIRNDKQPKDVKRL
jgi:DNA ligase D-like protein (predicted ligase)